MSEQTAEATATETEGTEQTEQQQPKPTETVEFWKSKAREQEKRAKDNADAARRLTEIEESQKSEAQKAADRLAESEKRASQAEARVLRREVALEHKLAAEDAALLDTVTDEDAMRALAKRLAGADDGGKKVRNRVPREGDNHRPAEDEERRAVRNLFGPE